MLQKANRLTKKKDFERVFQYGRSFREGSMCFKAAENNLGNSRFGFVVSKKVSAKAAVRNKIRRKLREVIRGNMGRINGGADCVLIANPGLERKDSTEIGNITVRLLKKAEILADKSD